MRKHFQNLPNPAHNNSPDLLFANPWIPHAWPRLQILLSLPLRCNSPDHLSGRRIVLHDMKRRPVQPHVVDVCMRYRNVHQCALASPCIRGKEHLQVHHIIDDDAEQRQVRVVLQTRASHIGAEPCSKA